MEVFPMNNFTMNAYEMKRDFHMVYEFAFKRKFLD